jgi:tetratricopeptide (TPR) repeat protein
MQRDLPRQRGSPGAFTFEGKLENEDEILDGFLSALARNQLPPDAWSRLHAAAMRDERLSELAFSYEAASQGKRLKTLGPSVIAEFLYRASTFFSDAFGDEGGAVSYLERALSALPIHGPSFDRLDAIFTKNKAHKALAELCATVAPHRPRVEQIALLKRAAALFASDPAGDDRATELYQQVVRLDPHDEATRDVLEARLRKANRHRDVARLAEQALTIDPPLSESYAGKVRARLIELYAVQLHEPERSIQHVEVLLAADATHEEARRVATKLLEVKGLAARAAAALASAHEQVGVPADVAKFLSIELEHTRGPKRRDVLRKIGVLREDRLGDREGAFVAFEQALALDPSDDDLRSRFVALAGALGKELDAARTLTRVGTAVKDPELRVRLTAELGQLYLAGGDAKRARATFVGVLATPDLPPRVGLVAARALCAIYAAEKDPKALADALERVALLEPDPELRRAAFEELAELASGVLNDDARAIGAWKNLVQTGSRARALAALEPLYEAAGDAVELANVLEERAKDAKDPEVARTLAFRAADVLTARANDSAKASAAWRRVVDKFGAARDVHARWLPLLEALRQWSDLAIALDAEATLAPESERAALYAKLGVVRLQKTRDIPGAIEALRRALAVEPAEKTSRSALEKLLGAGEHRLAAADVLEPLHRRERNVAGMLRVLDVKATLLDDPDARLRAIEEAATYAESNPPDDGKALEWAARGLREAVENARPLAAWLDRVDRLARMASDPKNGALVLARGLGDAAIDSLERLHLAKTTADALAAAGDVTAALALYRRALAFEPSSTELLSRIDDLLREQGSPTERVQLYTSALDRGPSPQRRRELLHKIGAIQKSDVGDMHAAIDSYRTALADDPSDADARVALAALYSETDQWDRLSDLLEEQLAKASGEEAKRARARIAEVAALHGQPNRARAHARHLLGEAILSSEELGALERVAEGIGDVQILREVLLRRAGHAEDPRDQAHWLDRLGALELESQNSDGALVLWKRAAQIAEKTGDEENARRLYERVRQVSPKDGEAAFHLAGLLERAEEWDKLPELYSILLEHTELPGARVSILMRHARVLSDHMGDPASALVSVAQAFELASDSSEYREVLSTFTALALLGKATHIFAQAMDDAIVRHAGDSPEKAAQRADLWMAKARVLSTNRDGRDVAAAAYRAILDDRGVDEGRTKAALLGFEMLLSREPFDAWQSDRRWLLSWKADRAPEGELAAALLAWATAEESTFGDLSRALELYRRVERIDPENGDVLAAISRLALATGDVAGAVTALVSRRDRSEGVAKNALDLEIATILLYRSDRAEEALAPVDSILKSAPQDEGALALGAQLLNLPKAHARAVLVLERAESAGDDPKQRAKILRHLLDARSDPPDSHELRRQWYERLLDVYHSQGRLDLALATVLDAAEELPVVDSLLDRAEALARELERPVEVAKLYHRTLAQPLPKESAIHLGQRAVAFHEEWFEDSAGVVRILERVLEIDMGASWAFDRLKLLFDAAERWDDLFVLFDRAIEVADDGRKALLYEDAAQIAKDFANNRERAVGYLEKLLPLKPGDARLVASLERLYERHGSYRELIGLLSSQISSLAPLDASLVRARIARLWLDEIGDGAAALVVIEEILAPARDARPSGAGAKDEVRVCDLLEKVLSITPPHVESRESMPPAMEGERGRRDSVPVVKSGKRMSVRQRAVALLKELYTQAGHEADLVRVLEIELEAIKSIKELMRRHRLIAETYTKLGNDTAALEHLASLVLLKPDVADHRAEFADLAGRIGRYDRLADVLARAAEDSTAATLKVELLMHAGNVHLIHLDDAGRAIELFLRVLAIPGVAPESALAAARRVEPLLGPADRPRERLDVNEQIAELEGDPEAKAAALTTAARLATDLGETSRAIASWEARLAIGDDPVALDGVIDLLEREKRWQDLIGALERRVRSGRTDGSRRQDLVRVARIVQDELGDGDAAILAWDRVNEQFGETDETTDALASLFARTERFAELAQLLERAGARAEQPERKAKVLRALGDVQRVHTQEFDRAIGSYDAALGAEPSNEPARAGLREFMTDDARRPAAVAALMRAYAATDEWPLTLALTEARLVSAPDARARVEVLRDAARFAEARGGDANTAFRYMARAFVEAPTESAVETELTRLAEATGEWRAVADAYERALAIQDGAETAEPGANGRGAEASSPAAPGGGGWIAPLRFRLGGMIEARIDEPERALEVYLRAAVEVPTDLDVARAAIRVAARTGRWGSLVSVLRSASSAMGRLPENLPLAAEEFIREPAAWDAMTHAMGAMLEERADLPPRVARDLEAQLGAWHRDRRHDPDLAEAAFARALAHDPESTELLSSLVQLQRRERNKPLIDSLLRLSRAARGDLDLIREAAEIATDTVKDGALAQSILESLHGLAKERWLGSGGEPIVAAGHHVLWATHELVRIYEEEKNPERIVDLLVETSKLPFERSESRAMLHEAAQTARHLMSDPGRAIGLYASLFDEDTTDEVATVALSALYEAQGKKTALLALERRRIADAKTADRRIELRRAVARIERSLGNVEGAIATLLENLAESPRHVETVRELVGLFEDAGRVGDLVDLLAAQAELALAAGERNEAADTWGRAAVLAEERLATPDRARGYHEKVLEIEERPASLDALARLLAAKSDHARAAAVLERLRVVSPAQRAALTLRLADALSESGRSDVALARLEEATREYPDEEALRGRLQSLYETASAWEPLAVLLAEGAAHAPDKSTRLTRLLRAAKLFAGHCGKADTAIPLLEQASDLEPSDRGIRLALADALGAAGRFSEARAMLRAIIDGFGGRRPKERAPAHYHLARLELAMGDRARALVELDAATRIDPANPQILRSLAELARDDGQLERAERSYRALLVALPRAEESEPAASIVRTEVLLELSAVAERQGEHDRAREILESALETGAKSDVEERRLEEALGARGDHATLVRALEARLARTAPSETALILSDLATVLDEHLGRTADAFVARLRAVSLAPGSARAHEAALVLARRTEGLSRYAEELRGLAEARERAGDLTLGSDLFLRLGKVEELELGDDVRAAKTYERAQSLHREFPPDSAGDGLARKEEIALLRALDRVYERLGEGDAQGRVLARRAQIESRDDDPHATADALYRLAAFRLAGDESVDEGATLLDKALEVAPDFDRAESILRIAAHAHPAYAHLVTLYERVGRAPGHERALVDALGLRSALDGGTPGPLAEAVEVAQRLGDSALAESILTRFVDQRAAEGALAEGSWALIALAAIREAKGDISDAIALKERAAQVVDPADARHLRFECARLASEAVSDLGVAARMYEALLEHDPTDREAWDPLLDVYRRMGQPAKLAGFLGKVVEVLDDPILRSKLRLERVRVMMKELGLGDDAGPALREIVEDDPSQVEAAILLAGILERKGDEVELAALLGKQLDAAKDRQDGASIGSLSLRLGRLLERTDRLAARNVLYSGLDWGPEDKEILRLLSSVLKNEEEHADRADVLERLLVLTHDEEAESLALEVHALRSAEGNEEGAERALEVGFRAHPVSAILRERLERAYRERGAWGKLAEVYAVDARGRTDKKARVERLREAASLYRRELGDPARAAPLLAEARKDAPDDAGLLGDRVDTLAEAKQYREAIDEVSTELLRMDEDGRSQTALLARRAMLRIEVEDDAGATADLEVAANLAGDAFAAEIARELGRLRERAATRGDDAAERSLRLRLASVLSRAGDTEGARNHLSDLIRRDPKDRDALRALARIDELLGRWDAVSATCRRLVALEEGEAVVETALRLAAACERAGRLSDARGALEGARRVAPHDEALRERLVHLYEHTGAYRELAEMSLLDAKQAKDVAGRFAHLVRAGSFFIQHESDLAVAIVALEEAHALRPSDLECIVLLADAYTLAGRTADAIDLINQAIGSYKGKRSRELSALYHRLARAAHSMGDRAKEMAWLASALDMDAQNGFVASELASLAMEQGQLDLATRALRAITLLREPSSSSLSRALAYQHLGEVARQQGDFKRAVLLLKRAIDDDPTLASARALLDALQAE